MSEAPVILAFPRRPLNAVTTARQRKERNILLWWAMLLALPSLYFGYGMWRDNALRHDLRAHGVEAEVLSSEGSCLSRRQVGGDTPRGCNLTIAYRLRPGEGGAVRTADVWSDGAAPVFTPPALYDPAHPDRVMLKPEAERDLRVSEMVGPLILLILPLAALLLWFANGRRGFADAARDPRPAIVPLERTERKKDRLDVYFRRQGAEHPTREKFFDGGPLLVRPPPGSPPGQGWALALLGAQGQPWLLDAELRYLELSDEERAAILRAADA